MKLYPKDNGEGFTKEEIERGIYLLYIDVQCVSCKHNQALTEGKKCIRCGDHVQ